jgi:hypothetical protein
MPGNFESVRNVALQKETFPQLRGAGENRHKGYKRHSATIAVDTDASRSQIVLLVCGFCCEC